MSPDPPAEATALLALMLLHDARREARQDDPGNLIVLEEQDRGKWNRAQIVEATPLVEETLRREPGPYALQSAIASLHCRAARAEETNWPQIVGFYDLLLEAQPSPIVSLNRAVAVAMVEGPRAGLRIIDEIAADGELERYHLFHAAKADLLRRLRSFGEAAKSYRRALQLGTNDSERRYLERRLQEVQSQT